MDLIIIGIIVLAAVGYLFLWFRSAAKRRNGFCGCGTCEGSCGSAKKDCGGNPPGRR
ncbi:MAG: FeoB-associated Cys-rich membrane protein [Deltaproteobacteria bacterium]|nr:FeoB-associated Cys-rich membrane protein [Deltaproteobacteria bacterium]